MVQYLSALDATFAALADPTRRGILSRLGRQDASISDLAGDFGMTLTGVRKHIRVLEEAGFVVTEKVGRVRICRIGPRGLGAESAWIAEYQQMLADRLDHIGARCADHRAAEGDAAGEAAAGSCSGSSRGRRP